MRDLMLTVSIDIVENEKCVKVNNAEYETTKEELLDDITMDIEDNVLGILYSQPYGLEAVEDYLYEDTVDEIHSFIEANFEDAHSLAPILKFEAMGLDMYIDILILPKEELAECA